jgi:hypothetical protein
VPVEFQVVGGERRSVYRQTDGSIELADACTCWKDPFCCPIDEHKIKARQKEMNNGDTTSAA